MCYFLCYKIKIKIFFINTYRQIQLICKYFVSLYFYFVNTKHIHENFIYVKKINHKSNKISKKKFNIFLINQKNRYIHIQQLILFWNSYIKKCYSICFFNLENKNKIQRFLFLAFENSYRIKKTYILSNYQ